MTRKFAIVAVLVIVVATIAGGVRSRAFRRHASTATAGQSTGEKYEADRIEADYHEAITTVEERYVGEIDYEKATQAAIQGMLSTLDPHSILMDPEQARDMDVSTSGKFGGLGIVIRMIDRKLTVVKPMKNTPASRKGIKAGDHIVRINHEPTENLTSNEAVDRMRGDPKTGVTLWIERKGAEGLLRFDLIRDITRLRVSVERKSVMEWKRFCRAARSAASRPCPRRVPTARRRSAAR